MTELLLFAHRIGFGFIVLDIVMDDAHRIGFGFIVLDVVMDDGGTLVVLLLLLLLLLCTVFSYISCYAQWRILEFLGGLKKINRDLQKIYYKKRLTM